MISFISELKDDKIHTRDLKDRLLQIGVIDRGTLTYVLGDLLVKAGFEKVKALKIYGKISTGWKRVESEQQPASPFSNFNFD